MLIILFVGLIAWKLGVNYANQASTTNGIPPSSSSPAPTLHTPVSAPSSTPVPTPLSMVPTEPSIPTNTISPEQVELDPLPIPSVYPEASAQEKQAFAAEVKDIPFTGTWSEGEKALIQLDSDPRMIRSWLSLLVPKQDETLTIFFKEQVDQAKIEKSIKKITGDNQRVYPELLLHWSSDLQLHVKILASRVKTIPHITNRYDIDLTDALAQSNNSGYLYKFTGIITEPSQLWKVALDQSSMQKLTSLDKPYGITQLDHEGRYLLLSRNSTICDCDRTPIEYFSVYDTTTTKRIDYPIVTQLAIKYRGSGSFVADRRGFFYEIPSDPTVQVPMSDTAIAFKLPDFVYGAAFSKDGKTIIAVTGPKEQGMDTKLDMRLIDVSTRKEMLLKQVIRGRNYQSQVSDMLFPISFIDDGKDVYFTLLNPNPNKHEEMRYKLNWKLSQISEWDTPVLPTEEAAFQPSDDGRYQIYLNYGLYSSANAKQSIMLDGKLIDLWGGMWIPNTHDYVSLTPKNNYASITVFHADTLEETYYNNILMTNPWIQTASTDGKWLYVTVEGVNK